MELGGNHEGASFENASSQPQHTTKDYQDEAETRDSKYKAVWDNEMGNLKNSFVPYQKAFVLLLSWHKDVDDLKTDEEVTALDNLFKEKFQYETVRKTLVRDPKKSAQAQVNRYLAEFVYDHDDTNTLLIIYYAGHGRPGKFRGNLRLTSSTSLRTEPDNGLHEIVWGSAEHNIKETRADVLVIFDCCHAGELERNVRGHFARRAFEFLAATSANSTTKKPSKESFTSALIWSLSRLVDQGSFSTQELLRTIQVEAPDFPPSQSPRLSERQPSSQRKIMFAPLTEESVKKAIETSQSEEEEDSHEETKQDLLLRFVFDREITESMVKEIASHLQRLIHEKDIKAKTVAWEGINMPPSLQFKDTMIAHPGIRFFQNSLHRIRSRKSRLEASPTEEALPLEDPKPVQSKIRHVLDDLVPMREHNINTASTREGPSAEASESFSDEAVQGPITSGPPSVDGSFVTTPDPRRLTAEPEIGDDQGASSSKELFLDTGRCDVSPPPHFNDRGGRESAQSPISTTSKSRKRDRSMNDDSLPSGKRSRRNMK